MRLFKTTLFKDTATVISEPASNDADRTDFENNHKASATTIDDFKNETPQTIIEVTWTVLKTKFTNSSDLFYFDNVDNYEILFFEDGAVPAQAMALHDKLSNILGIADIGGEKILKVFNIGSPNTSTGTFAPVSVGATATEIVAANPNRIALIITVKDDKEVFIGLDNTVTIANGFPHSQGDVFEIDQDDLYTGAVFGIVASGTADVRFIEI